MPIRVRISAGVSNEKHSDNLVISSPHTLKRLKLSMIISMKRHTNTPQLKPSFCCSDIPTVKIHLEMSVEFVSY